jgi:hypothetical protein
MFWIFTFEDRVLFLAFQFNHVEIFLAPEFISYGETGISCYFGGPLDLNTELRKILMQD